MIGDDWYERRFVFPQRRPDLGYYDLRIDIETEKNSYSHDLRLIVCPELAYIRPGWRTTAKPPGWRFRFMESGPNAIGARAILPI